MTWNETIDSFRTYLVLEKSLSPNSVEAYLNDIRKLAAYCEKLTPPLDPKEASYNVLNEFLMVLKDTGVTPRTQARSISSIKSFFKYLLYDGTIGLNPATSLDSPKIGRSLPSILSVEEIEAMIDSIDMNKQEGQRNKAILETLYSCGLRVSELVNLKLSQINFRTGYIKIEGKGNKERIVPLGARAKDEIRCYLKKDRDKMKKARGHEDILFLNKMGKALSRVMIFNIIKETARRAGLSKVVSPHTFRHSFASHLVNGGADIRTVQDMLGHESILTTEIYTHLDNNFTRDTVTNFHPRAKKSRK
ncbi:MULTISPECIES: site-specific tyrosine recombinase XerD [Butyricimonas]|uniref:Tyrosine recombinase XerC n=1 Tax=Butyricimonas hominis TaxID=2763032 RepID=A0ABR7D222_9BACT|nr:MULTISPECIES: site-specific tyrosine recombinase XerD [Butyricimonas]MBC5621977.1 site-specific tyrosine recombinase XerD [Butyricimonas hominis]MCB6972341.1 site-specific tyrosine recombinase XerD [Butyricimonas synergistica]MCG4519349.1 site-specific tyrosine recombinase XerD [Butyricimonas sp. DFI.6.44]